MTSHWSACRLLSALFVPFVLTFAGTDAGRTHAANTSTVDASAVDLADAHWENDIAAFEAADRASAPPHDAIVFVGSSSIRLWSTLVADFPAFAVVNRGFGGSEVRDSTRYLPRIVLPLKPRAVVLYAGDNDLAAGRSVDQIVADVQAFVDALRTESHAPLFYIAIKPSPARIALLPQSKAANARIAAWMANRNDLHFIDIATPMLDADGQPRGDLFVGDRLHLDAKGYALWSEVIGNALKSLDRQRSADRAPGRQR